MFEPMLGAVCPLQQIAAFGSADDARVAGTTTSCLASAVIKIDMFG